MTKYLLFLLFVVTLVADWLGLNLSLAPGLSIKNAFLYLIFVGIAIETALKRNRRFELLPVIIPYSLCFFYAVFTLVVILLLINYPGYRPLQSAISLKAEFADNILIFLVVFFGVLVAKDALWLAKAMIWTVFFSSVITVIEASNLFELGLLQVSHDGRVTGPIGEPNQYAAFLALFLPPSLGLVMIERGGKRALALLGFAATVLAFLMTVSRGGIVGVALGAAMGTVFMRRFVSGKSVAIGAVASVVGGLAALSTLYFAGFGDLLVERFVDLSGAGNSWELSSGRTEIWSGALAKMFEQPLSIITGYGWDTYRQAFYFRYAPHNSYLKIFFELGSIGLFLIVFALVSILIIARRGLREAEGDNRIMLMSSIFGFLGLLVAIFFVDLTTPWIFIWAFLGTVMRISVNSGDAMAFGQNERRIPDLQKISGAARTT